MSKPVKIIFIPGAWHVPKCFDAVIEQLETAGYSTDRVSHASQNNAEPAEDFHVDVDSISAAINRSISAGLNIILVCHSYGGIPTTQAVKEIHTASARQTSNQEGGIVHIVYCCSFLLQKNQQISDVCTAPAPPMFSLSDGFLIVPDTALAKYLFYNDMDDDGIERAFAMLKGQSDLSLRSQVTHTGWKHVPCTYIHCTKDNAIPLDAQKLMVDAARKEGCDIRTETLECSHSPFYTKVDEMVTIIRRAAGELI